MTTHTPGPWKSVPDTNNGWEIRGNNPRIPIGRGAAELHSVSGGFPVAQTIAFEPWSRFTTQEYQEMVAANFRLLAAAPDLLAALEGLGVHENLGLFPDCSDDNLCPVCAALAKAAG